mmetsp:Transcript_31704/g.102403  ORF Transcript_31704/g.102403 Transcript_31704/m.102403 type:complete len:201 (+) Transcript_31704:909-1511(+)
MIELMDSSSGIPLGRDGGAVAAAAQALAPGLCCSSLRCLASAAAACLCRCRLRWAASASGLAASELSSTVAHDEPLLDAHELSEDSPRLAPPADSPPVLDPPALEFRALEPLSLELRLDDLLEPLWDEPLCDPAPREPCDEWLEPALDTSSIPPPPSPPPSPPCSPCASPKPASLEVVTPDSPEPHEHSPAEETPADAQE